MELFNSLPGSREQDLADFLTFIPIYSSKRRINAYYSLLRKQERLLKDKVVCEAGAGRGLISQRMAEMGCEKVYAVERSGVLFEMLEETLADTEAAECVEEDIEFWEPPQPIDAVVHEFYGPLVLDESMLVLKELMFEPGVVLPDGGRLWAMPIHEADVRAKEPNYQSSWQEALSGALISDLFDHQKFQPVWEVFAWDVHQDQTTFRWEVPADCDYLAFCGEITHEGQSVLKMWWTNNWPVIYTPVAGRICEFGFRYEDGYTEVKFDWIE